MALPNLDAAAVISAKPGSEAIVEAALRALVGASRHDSGCISYDLFASDSTPGTSVTIEKWQSQEDLDVHMASSHIADVIAAAGDHFDGFPAIHTLLSIESGTLRSLGPDLARMGIAAAVQVSPDADARM